MISQRSAVPIFLITLFLLVTIIVLAAFGIGVVIIIWMLCLSMAMLTIYLAAKPGLTIKPLPNAASFWAFEAFAIVVMALTIHFKF